MAAGDGVDVLRNEDVDQNEKHLSNSVCFTLPGEAYDYFNVNFIVVQI